MAYASINPVDLATISGIYPVKNDGKIRIGMEGSGYISAVGQKLKYQRKVGEKVHVIGQGTWSEYLITESENCFPIKDGLSMEEAACHFVNPATVVYISRLAKESGCNAAINTAGSSTLGRMMIRYFKEKGIKLISVVRNQKYVKELLDMGADYVLNSTDPNFETLLKETSAKISAKVCFNPLGGSMISTLLNSMPNGSKIYVYGILGGDDLNGLKASRFLFSESSI